MFSSLSYKNHSIQIIGEQKIETKCALAEIEIYAISLKKTN